MITRAQSLAILLLAAVLRPGMAQELVVVVESPSFTVDTRLAGGSPVLAGLVVTATSGAFTLDTRLAARPEYLIVETVSPAFELNTMWVRIRQTGRAPSPLELYWTTNAPGFGPQWARPPLGRPLLWQDLTNTITESDGFYRALLNPEEAERYFRLKL